ncbi:MAG TPA: YIP1 family protein [Vicinamibacterales bacterium]|nr:YIP1 family protein [Vicinamibacterales bacterium]
MTIFFRRFVGALMLDAGAFEDIEAHRDAAVQSMIVVMLACAAGGVAAAGLGAAQPASFVAGIVLVLGAWLVWVTVIAALGTIVFAEPQTKSNLTELLRTLGFAAAPAIFLVFASMRAAALFILVLVSLWMIAAAVLGLRQALDYRSTARAIAVCVIGWIVALGAVAAIAATFTVDVN